MSYRASQIQFDSIESSWAEEPDRTEPTRTKLERANLTLSVFLKKRLWIVCNKQSLVLIPTAQLEWDDYLPSWDQQKPEMGCLLAFLMSRSLSYALSWRPLFLSCFFEVKEVQVVNNKEVGAFPNTLIGLSISSCWAGVELDYLG